MLGSIQVIKLRELTEHDLGNVHGLSDHLIESLEEVSVGVLVALGLQLLVALPRSFEVLLNAASQLLLLTRVLKL